MRCIAFNKPYGVLSQFTNEGTGHPTLKDFINVPNVYPAGRLDRDSEGLLLLADDGALIKRLTDPNQHIEKTYLVMVEGDPTPEKLTQLSDGVQIKGHFTRPAFFRLIPDPRLPERPKPVTPHGPTAWLEVKLCEGKKRQIRRMTATVGLFTLRIFRIAIGFLELGDLAVGTWRNLEESDLRLLK